MGENFGIKMIVRTLFLKWVYKHIDYALYVGTNNKKYYLRHGIKEEQLYFAPHAIDNDRYSVNKEIFKTEAAAWRKNLGIAQDAIVFLFAGKLEINKNAQLLIKAYKEISHNKNIHLVIVGNGVMEQRLKKKYFYLSNLHFTDFQNQSKMPVVYNLGDILVLPSKGPVETWGLAINEAMACSKAIIASNRCGAAIDLVRNNVKNNDKKDLAKKMEQIIISRDSIIKMGERSDEIIKDWNFENICKPIEEITGISK
jgi:glycosyltransferase involved in cell wall biosynthesis